MAPAAVLLTGSLGAGSPGWGMCLSGGGLDGEPDHAFDVVDQVGNADFGCRSGDVRRGLFNLARWAMTVTVSNLRYM